MTNKDNTKNLSTNQELKLEWNSPELEILTVNEQTLSGTFGSGDAGVFS